MRIHPDVLTNLDKVVCKNLDYEIIVTKLRDP